MPSTASLKTHMVVPKTLKKDPWADRKQYQNATVDSNWTPFHNYCAETTMTKKRL